MTTRRRPNQVLNFPRETVVSAGVELQTLAFAHYRCLRPHKWSVSTRLGLVFFRDGDGWFHRENREPEPIYPGTAIWLFPGEEHWRQPTLGGFWDHYWLFIGGPLAEALVQMGVLDPEQPVHRPASATALETLFCEALDHAARGDAAWVCGRALEFVRLSTQDRDQPDHDPVVEIITRRLQGQPEKLWDYARLAAEHSLSYPTLRRRFRAVHQVSLHQYVLRLRLQTACGLLLAGEPIKAVAARVGLSDQTHFTRMFRRHYGCTPGEYQTGG